MYVCIFMCIYTQIIDLFVDSVDLANVCTPDDSMMWDLLRTIKTPWKYKAYTYLSMLNT